MSEELFRLVVTVGVCLAAICFVVQAIATVVLLVTVSRIKAKMEPVIEKTGPLMDQVKSSLAEMVPKLSVVATDVADLSKAAREQVNQIGKVVTELAQQAKAQVARIDGAVESTVGSVQHAGESVKDAVLKPVREVNGVMAGIRTAISVYAHGRRQSVDHATQDEEMFI